MEARTFEIKTPLLTGGRSQMPLARTDLVTVMLNYYTPGRKNTLHNHPGEDHIFVVLDGEVTFYDKEDKSTVVKKGEGILIPGDWYYCFQNTGGKDLAMLRFGARKEKSGVARVESSGRVRGEDATEYEHVNGDVIQGKFWRLA
jgi:oxalate decarboxylase/phosphoglucose isomerase-like protein (cupin superfamily)